MWNIFASFRGLKLLKIWAALNGQKGGKMKYSMLERGLNP